MTTNDRQPSHTTLILVRHGQSATNDAAMVAGWTDAALTEMGREQAERVARRLAECYRPDALYASTLVRAVDTARAIGRLVGLEPRTDPDLRECNIGLAEGLRLEEVMARFPEAMPRMFSTTDFSYTWPEGENRGEFNARVLAAFDRIVAAHLGQTIIVVGHGGPMAVYQARVATGNQGRWFEFNMDNCAFSEVRIVDGIAQLVQFNVSV